VEVVVDKTADDHHNLKIQNYTGTYRKLPAFPMLKKSAVSCITETRQFSTLLFKNAWWKNNQYGILGLRNFYQWYYQNIFSWNRWKAGKLEGIIEKPHFTLDLAKSLI